MKLINLPAFIISFLFGVLYVYFTSPPQQDIVVYPTDDNKHLFQFRDKISNCFQLKQNIVKCSNMCRHVPTRIQTFQHVWECFQVCINVFQTSNDVKTKRSNKFGNVCKCFEMFQNVTDVTKRSHY